MRLAGLIVGAAGAGAIGVTAIQHDIEAEQERMRQRLNLQDEALDYTSWADEAEAYAQGEANCPDLVGFDMLRDVERDGDGRIIAAAFDGAVQPPDSAPSLSPIT